MTRPHDSLKDKLRHFFTATKPAILNDFSEPAVITQDSHYVRKPKRLFIPTLGSLGAVSFWVGLVSVFSFYGVAVQFHHVHSLYDAWVIFFDFFIVQLCIIFAIVGYIHFSIDYYSRLPMKAQIGRTLIAATVLTPPATLLGKLIEFFCFEDSRLFENIYLEIGVNTTLALLITSLLLYYFRVQYQKIRHAQQRYHQKLIEQNDQLKARITPHFFFNMLNTVQYLSETNPAECTVLIEHISKLYRVSFAEIKEIALTDEIELCEHYLNIERYRFDDKLKVHWDLPDEDILYDMVITSLTLQMIIEKMLLLVVEMSIQTIYLTLKIHWVDNIAALDVRITLPDNLTLSDLPITLDKADSVFAQPVDSRSNTSETDLFDKIAANLNYKIQTENLQYYFGNTANITYYIDNTLSPAQLVTQIRYPLIDNSVLI